MRHYRTDKITRNVRNKCIRGIDEDILHCALAVEESTHCPVGNNPCTEYDKALEEINMKTEEIHEADKKLELQLKQLDTEQETIVTELESVKKVIEKNIEVVFKTFQS